MTTPDLAELVSSLRAFVQEEGIQPDPDYIEWNSGLYAVLDCVYSSQVRYALIVLPLLQQRFPVATGLKDVPELTFSAFLDSVGRDPTSEQLETYAATLRTRHKIAGRLKVEVAYDVCRFFVDRGYETRAALRELGDDKLEQLVLVDLVGAVRGIGPVLGRYLLLLLGLEQHVKPDTLLVRLLGRVGRWQPRFGQETDMQLIKAAVTAVAEEIGTTPARLDNALWFYESTGAPKVPSPGRSTNPAHPQVPRTMADPTVSEGRQALLKSPHHAGLLQYVGDLRAQVHERGLDVPDLDPLGGGDETRILYLLEAPGPKAAKLWGGSGFISMDNNDATAQTVFDLTRHAGVPRDWISIWNIVPWYVGDGKRIRAVKPIEIKEGRGHLRELLALLPKLRVVVTLGEHAAKGWEELIPEFPQLVTLTTWHTSGQALNPDPRRRAHVLTTLQLAQQIAEYEQADNGPKW